MWNPTTLPERSRMTRKAVGSRRHHASSTATDAAGSQRADDLGDRGAVGRTCRLRRVEMLGAREEGLAHDRVLDDVQQVGGVPPDLLGRRPRHLVAELPPGGGAVPTRPVRIRGPEMRRDRLADRVVEEQAVVAELDERQAQQAVERVLRRGVGQHRRQERHRRPPNHGRRVQRLPGHRIEPVEVQLRELRDDRLDGDGLDVHVRSVVEGGRREPQRERVAPREAVDPFGVGGVDARLAQERLGVGARQPPEREVAEQRAERALPAGHRRLAPGQDDPHALAQRRDERLLQPGVEQAEHLVGIEHEHDPLAEAVEPATPPRLGSATRRRLRPRAPTGTLAPSARSRGSRGGAPSRRGRALRSRTPGRASTCPRPRGHGRTRSPDRRPRAGRGGPPVRPRGRRVRQPVPR